MSHKHNDDKFFNELLKSGGKTSDSDENEVGLISDDQLTDNYMSEHEKLHSQSITNILRDYEYSYRNKVNFQRTYRKVLFWGCSILIILFAIVSIWSLYYGVVHASALKIEGVATIIATVISLIVSILKLVHIITKYCFPEKNDEYILKIVDSIQKNDLERAKEHYRQQSTSKKEDVTPPEADK